MNSAPTAGTARSTCAWCGVPFDERAHRPRGRTVCSLCDVATTDPWPSSAELDAAYSGWYRPASGRFGKVGDRIFGYLRGRLSGRLDRVAPSGPVLDVGAGDGALVDALRGRGREAKGLDRYTTREDFLAKDLDEVTGAWAAIVFWHSLEHLPEPTRALRSAKELLLPDGVMVIAVPNYASLQAAVFGDRWFPLDLARHLVHIPARSLLDFLKAQGLTIGRVSYTRGGQVVFGWLHGLVGAVWSGSDLYDTIRSKQARSKPMSTARRVLTLALGAVLLPVALIASAAEVALRRSGTVYVEARLPARDG